ncbi:hypothetical protein P3G55_09845 [Leptospira sp. 96542]|nr:hypothetical protein [Leptospira sp. 96542]
MIRSRVFIAFAVIFFLGVLLTYTLVDFREQEDKAFDYYQSEEYEKVISLYNDKNPPNSEFEITILSQTISQLEKKLNVNNAGKWNQKDLQKFLTKKKDYKIEEWETTRGIYLHIDDPYFPMLKKHGDAYKRALITKIQTIQKPIPKKEATQYLLLLILEDPRGMEESYSKALINILNFPFEPIGEIESEFLLETLHFLTSSANSDLYKQNYTIRGQNVNLRSGPGRENPEIGKGNDSDSAICLEEDQGKETIAGMDGQWMRCYFPKLAKSAWIFSGFLKQVPHDNSYVDNFQKRFKAIENEVRIDFEGWSGSKIPSNFFGTYIPREPEQELGETGFPIYGTSPKNESYQRICKKVAGEKNYFEFSFHPTHSKTPITFLEIHLVFAGASHTAYTISADSESIWVNKNRYLLDGEKRRENLSLHIESREKDKLLGSLWRRNTGLLLALRSNPLDLETLQSGKYSWEICIPQAIKPTREKILLFEVRTGVH